MQTKVKIKKSDTTQGDKKSGGIFAPRPANTNLNTIRTGSLRKMSKT